MTPATSASLLDVGPLATSLEQVDNDEVGSADDLLGVRAPLWGMVATVAFLGVAAWVAARGDLPGDRWILERLHDLVGSTVDGPMGAISTATDTGPLAAVAAGAAVALAARRRWRHAGALLLSVGAAIAINPLFKEIVERPRPTVREIPRPVSRLSFPSGHAATSAALVGGLLLAAPRRRAVPLVAAGGTSLLLVAASQLALGAHHPSDIVAAWLWIAAWITLVVQPITTLPARRAGRAMRTTDAPRSGSQPRSDRYDL